MTAVAFPDCALPDGCECHLRGYPRQGDDHTACLIPRINAMAAKLGWPIPYEVQTLDQLLEPLRGE